MLHKSTKKVSDKNGTYISFVCIFTGSPPLIFQHTWPSVSQARSILLSAFSSSNSSSSLVILDDLDILSNSSVLSEDDERGARTRRALMQAMEGEEREEPLSVLAVTASPW